MTLLLVWFLKANKTAMNVILRISYLYDPVMAHMNPLTSNIVQ